MNNEKEETAEDILNQIKAIGEKKDKERKENQVKISFVEFKEWLTLYIASLGGDLPQYDEWKVIKENMDLVYTYDDNDPKVNKAYIYDPSSLEDYTSTWRGRGRGSRVETLPDHPYALKKHDNVFVGSWLIDGKEYDSKTFKREYECSFGYDDNENDYFVADHFQKKASQSLVEQMELKFLKKRDEDDATKMALLRMNNEAEEHIKSKGELLSAIRKKYANMTFGDRLIDIGISEEEIDEMIKRTDENAKGRPEYQKKILAVKNWNSDPDNDMYKLEQMDDIED